MLKSSFSRWIAKWVHSRVEWKTDKQERENAIFTIHNKNSFAILWFLRYELKQRTNRSCEMWNGNVVQINRKSSSFSIIIDQLILKCVFTRSLLHVSHPLWLLCGGMQVGYSFAILFRFFIYRTHKCDAIPLNCHGINENNEGIYFHFWQQHFIIFAFLCVMKTLSLLPHHTIN